METYKSSPRYRIFLTLGTGVALLVLLLGVIELFIGNNLTALAFSLFVLGLFYLLFFMVGKEVSIEPNRITFRSQMRESSFEPSEIKSIHIFQSVNVLLWHSGDKERAPLVCIIRLKGHLLRCFLFGNAIEQHKKLHSKLLAMHREAESRTK